MKQEASKKSKLWLWLVIGAVALLAIAGVVLALIFGFGSEDSGPKGGRAELYWNVDRVTYTANSESGLSTRERGEDGEYHVRFAINGELVEYVVADKQLINYIDSLDVMGLVKDSDGVVVDVIDPKDIAKEVTKNAYVKTATEKRITANSSIAMNGMNIKIELDELTEIYDVTQGAEVPGKVLKYSDLTAMDTLTVFANDMEQVTHVYVTAHPRESKVYWRANQLYSSAEKSTTREPDENGAYTIPFFADGERVELKTKDKAIATKIDSISRWKCHFGLEFDEEGYIIEQYPSAMGIQGVMVTDGWDVVEINGQDVTIQRLTTNDGSVWTGTIPEDCIIYDVSYTAMSEKRQGQQVDSLKMGDRVTVWTDTNGQVILVYVSNRICDSIAYWVPTRKYDSTKKETTREVGPSGYYEVELVGEGQPKQTYYIKDKETMSYLDSITQKCVGLKLSSGNIVECVYHFEALTGYTCATQGGVVTSVTGSIFSKISIGKPDSTVNLVLAPNARVYNVSAAGEMGAATTIQVNDHVYGYRQPTGEILIAFITKRAIGGDHLYWHLDKMYDSTKKVSTRVPDADGWYHLLFAYNGKQVTLKTKSLEIVESIDKLSIGATALDVSGDVITKVYDATYAYSGQKVASGYRFRGMTDSGKYHTVYNTDENKITDFAMAKDCVIYNVSPVFKSHQGEQIYSIPYNAMLTVFCNIQGEAKVVYVRSVDVDDMYWKTETLYDSSKKVTKRVPDADGYYWYTLAVNGKQVTLKTKDQKVANSMDSYNGGFGLNVVGDEIKGFVSTSGVKNVKGNGVNGYCVTAINGNKITLTYNKPGSSFGKTETILLSSSTKIADVSPSAENFGAYTTLKVGDTVRTYASRDNTTHSYVWVMARSTRAGGETGWCEVCQKNVTWNPILNSVSMTAADGHWYVTDDMNSYIQHSFASTSKDYTICLDLNGKTFTRYENRAFRVAENETMNIMDSVGGGKIVTHGGTSYNGGMFMITAGGKVNLYGGTLEYVDTGVRNGHGGNIYLSGANSVFNLYDGVVTGGCAYAQSKESPRYGGNFYLAGGATLNMYAGEISNGRAYGVYDVEAAKAVDAYGGNIYFTESSMVNIMGGVVKDGQAVRETFTTPDGKSVANISWGGNIYKVSTSKLNGRLFIENATVSGGSAHRGGNICVASGSAGIVELKNAIIKDGTTTQFGGNIMSMGGQWTVKDSQILNGVTGANGGNIYSQGGVYSVEGTHISDGVAPTGGNIYLYKNKTDDNIFTIKDGTVVENGVANDGHGGNIYVKNKNYVNLNGKAIDPKEDVDKLGIPMLPKLVVEGGKILNGTCSSGSYGGNIYCAGDMELKGGLISGGKAGTADYDIYLPGEKDGTVKVGSVQVDGKFRVNGSKELYLCDAPVLAQLNFAKGIKAVVGELTDGAAIKVVTTVGSPVFTTVFDGAKECADAGYFTAFNPTDFVNVTENNELAVMNPADLVDPTTVNAAAVAMDFTAADPETGKLTAKCPACNVEVEWEVLPANQTGKSMVLEGNHYYLSENVDYTANNYLYSITTQQRVCINLNGQDLTSTKRAFYTEKSGTVLSMMGEGTVTGEGYEGTGTWNGAMDLTTDANFYGGTYISTGTGPAIGNRKTSDGSAVVSIYDGVTIKNKSATGNALFARTNASLNICGGTITGNVIENACKGITVSGAPVINKLVLTPGALLTVGELTENAKIQVEAEGIFTEPFDKAEEYLAAGYFTSTLEMMVTENNELETIIPASLCEHCNQIVNWYPWTNGEKNGNKHYYLREGGFTQDAQYTITENADIILDLRGQTLTGATSKRLFLVRGQLTILDSEGGGAIESKVNPNGAGGVMMIANESGKTNSCVNMYGGTLKLAADHATNKNGGIISLSGNATFNMYGGIIELGAATVNGKTIYATEADLNIYGGEIMGGIYTTADTNVYLSGDAKIAKSEGGLFIAEGNLIDLGQLGANAEVYVSGAQGAITEVLTNAADYLTALKPAQLHWTLENIDGVLTLVDHNVPFDPNKVYEQAKAMDFTTTDPEGKVIAECPVCREEVEWLPLEANTAGKSKVMTGGHYYLSDSIDYTQNNYLYSFSTQETLCLNLNGQNLTTTARAFYTEKVGTVLNVMGEGTVTGAGYEGSGSTAGKWFGTFDLTTDANFYGGTYVSTGAGPAIGNRKTSAGEAMVNIYEGTTVVNENGIALYVLTNAGMTINGGNVTGKVIDSQSKGITVTGAPVIDYIDLTNGSLLKIGELTTGADITVDAEGIFTETLSDAAAVAGYFKGTEGRLVEAEGTALTVKAAPPAKSIYEQAKEMVFTTSEPDGKVTAICPVCETEQEWLPLPVVDDLNTTNVNNRKLEFKGDGHFHFYLSENVDYTQNTGFYGFYASACVNLNGQSVVSPGRVFFTEGTATVLNIMGDGTVTGQGYTSGSTVRAAMDCTAAVNLYGGIYENTTDRPVIWMRSSSNANCALGIYEGTTIRNTTGAASVKVTGKSSVNIYSGNIDSVVRDSATAVLTVEGNPVIGKLDLTNGETVQIGALTEGASIYVEANGVFTSSVADIDAAMQYITVAEGKKLDVEAGNLSVVDDTPMVCPHCGKTEDEITWTEWTAAYGKGTNGTITSGHYYLTADVTDMDGYYYIGTNTSDDDDGRSVDVVLDMRGFDLISSTRVFYGYANNHLTILDSVGGSVMQGGLATSSGGTVFFGDGGGKASLNLYDITIRDGATATRDKNGGVLFISGDSKLVMENCTLHATTADSGAAIAASTGETIIRNSAINGGTASGKGGAIYLGGAGKLVLENTTVTGGTAAIGDCIYLPANATFEMTGGEAEAVFVNKDSVSVKVSGAAVIGDLDLMSGAKADVEGLTTGAAITVTADGVFTNDLTDANAVIGYFTSGVAGKEVAVEGAALAIAEQTTEPEAPEISVYEQAKAMDFSAGGTVTAKCPACGVDHNWEPIPAPTSSSSKALPAGAYYVADNMEITKFWYLASATNGTVCVNLNGKNITNTADRVFYAENKAVTLNIMGEGVVTGMAKYPNQSNTNYVGVLDLCTATNLYGGTWKSTTEYPIIAARGSGVHTVVSIYEGTEIVRTAEDVAGLNLFIADATTVNMYGGVISGGTAIGGDDTTKYPPILAKAGGNILMKANIGGKAFTATFNMEGGEVLNGTAEAKGGNIAAVHTTGIDSAVVVNINGGKIQGGSVCAIGTNASVNVSGAPVVDYVDVIDANLLNVGELTEGASIAVSALDGAVITAPIAENAQTYAAYFADKDNGKSIAVNSENALYITEVCPHCGVAMSDIEWKALTLESGMKLTETGHFYLTQNYEGFTTQIGIKGGDIVIDFRGHTITTSGRGFYAGDEDLDTACALSLMDTVGTGGITATYTNGGGVLFVITAKTATTSNIMNIYGGTYQNTGSPANGGCVMTSRSVLNIYGGTFIGADIDDGKKGANLYNNGGIANIYGGTFTAGNAEGLGDCAYVEDYTYSGKTWEAQMNIYGGSFEGQFFVEKGADFSIEGAPVFTALELDETVEIALGELTTGADITVTADGAFTSANTEAENYLNSGWVKAAEGKQITVTDGVMSMSAVSVAQKVLSFFNMLCAAVIK